MLRDVRREQRRAVYDAAAGDTSVRSGAGDLNGEEVAGDYDNGIQEVIFVIKSVDAEIYFFWWMVLGGFFEYAFRQPHPCNQYGMINSTSN
ncbi:unnamed protein product [Rotaria sp. Silwood2]|nr:unnamed protein product [Rotaria sp. Silwood2]